MLLPAAHNSRLTKTIVIETGTLAGQVDGLQHHIVDRDTRPCDVSSSRYAEFDQNGGKGQIE